MNSDEIVEELRKLREDIDSMKVSLRFLIQGGIAQNKRIDTLESLVLTTSKLAQVISDLLTRHLEEIRRAMEHQNPLLPPPSSSPDSSKKKESHPEFG